MQNFTAIDFETANEQRTSACAIGVVVVENRQIVRQYARLIRPEPMRFASFNTAVHGLTAADVAGAPVFGELWPEIAADIVSAPLLVAHNTSFDMSVLQHCLRSSGIAANIPDAVCSCRMAKKLLPQLVNHKLNTLCKHFGIPLNHHDALSDAQAAARIILELYQER
ncbi:3'-5' exonuclease [Desulfurispirillum indicum]|uniref:Exonuclease RNase T and DNA polymerase III n=1 Tax=Desulfurispirillum indicum (strain ATCC BAA-1389 / DSM 22839 / S5) TaxID=653733 RepID=E6W3D7_DESIS|nr:3'-5' exonuclease [Desulfurispirillum indicum]ADU66891.1 Exonuclease RNase T and DNA polymerase III [Desulfurispirillum indicum S5]UCZ56208.1 3'-5' exonuclease [Desulfurispirillum indicum]